MTSITWNLLISYFMIRPVDPIFRVTTHVAKYNLVFVDRRNEVGRVETATFVNLFKGVEDNGMLAGVFKDLTFDLPCGGAEPLILGWHVTSIAGQVFFVVVTWSCKFRHI